jgi:2-polyprenyl-3-methyl-5-hydroxy-6-metoxy-1,4-benzoquinol methylase
MSHESAAVNASSQSITHQARVNEFFLHRAATWRDLYADPSVRGDTFRERQAAVLDWATGAAHGPVRRVLEVGCGAGFVSVELARRGCDVVAVDSVQSMVEMTRRHADAAGVGPRVITQVGDANALGFAPASFDVVVANGVLPWVADPAVTIAELARVAAPGGHVIVTTGNRAALILVLDPFTTPLVGPAKRWVRRTAERLGIGRGFLAPSLATYHYPWHVDRLLAAAGLAKVRSASLGFGPCTLFGRTYLPDSVGLVLNRWLAGLARRGTPLVRTGGITYLVHARKLPRCEAREGKGPRAGASHPIGPVVAAVPPRRRPTRGRVS